jgi:hypothetical protein
MAKLRIHERNLRVRNTKRKNLEREKRGDNLHTHLFILRPNVVLELDLPTDLTKKEAERLASLIPLLVYPEG